LPYAQLLSLGKVGKGIGFYEGSFLYPLGYSVSIFLRNKKPTHFVHVNFQVSFYLFIYLDKKIFNRWNKMIPPFYPCFHTHHLVVVEVC
jgi:hypothetical protein